jgi:hypothetical protein
VDLLNIGVSNFGAWLPKGTNWLEIMPVFTNSNDEYYNGWGWKTTPLTNRWNDGSVEQGMMIPGWAPAKYPGGHPFAGQNCDLAFELTTDEVGTNQWYGPISFKLINAPTSNDYVIGSVGDVGSGVQVLQRATNLVTVSNNWEDLTTNSLPWPPPFTNYWYRSAPGVSQEFYRIRQR